MIANSWRELNGHYRPEAARSLGRYDFDLK